MGQERRKTPAIADRLSDEHQFGRVRYSPIVPFQVPPPVPNPIISIVSRLLAELNVEFPYVQPHYQRFPYFEQELPAANPTIVFRHGQWLGDTVTPLIGVWPRHLPFPYFQALPSTTILFRYGYPLLQREVAFVIPQLVWFTRFYATPIPVGAVPVRYVVGMIGNVVPVETVLTSEAGTVPVREVVGPAHVVPVRETATETPRVKVRKV